MGCGCHAAGLGSGLREGRLTMCFKIGVPNQGEVMLIKDFEEEEGGRRKGEKERGGNRGSEEGRRN